MSTQFDILIIGTGLAGYVTAMEIRKHRQEVSIALITESHSREVEDIILTIFKLLLLLRIVIKIDL